MQQPDADSCTPDTLIASHLNATIALHEQLFAAAPLLLMCYLFSLRGKGLQAIDYQMDDSSILAQSPDFWCEQVVLDNHMSPLEKATVIVHRLKGIQQAACCAGESRYGQNVSGGGFVKASHHAALSLWIHPPISGVRHGKGKMLWTGKGILLVLVIRVQSSSDVCQRCCLLLSLKYTGGELSCQRIRS